MRQMPKMIKKNDVLLFAAVIIVAAALALIARTSDAFGGRGAFISVTIDGKDYGSYSLKEDTVIDIDEELGSNRIVISDGCAYMEYADCPDKYCVKHRPISKDKETIICLPHRLVVEVRTAS